MECICLYLHQLHVCLTPDGEGGSGVNCALGVGGGACVVSGILEADGLDLQSAGLEQTEAWDLDRAAG